MPKHAKYTDKNLVKYEETIVLHFDESGKTAWLTMENYGGVFHVVDVDEKTTATIGVPSKPEHLGTISIGEMLGVLDVIKFQQHIYQAIAEITGSNKPQVLSRQKIYRGIEKVLKLIGVKGPLGNGDPVIPYIEGESGFFRKAVLYLTLVKYEGGWLTKTRPGFPALTIEQAIRKYKKLGFTGYFPKPSLILQEQRTAYKFPRNTDIGQTQNTDTRVIDPIVSNIRSPDKPPLADYLEMVDDEIIRSLNPNNEDLQFGKNKDRNKQIRKNLDALKRRRIGEPGYLHCHLARICCFGFRGDTRPLQEIKRAGGLLPGTTRKDPGVAQFQEQQNALDALTKYYKEQYEKYRREEPKCEFNKYLDQDKVKELLNLYNQAIVSTHALQLREYVRKEDFKGYLSTSKSTAIAKQFVNAGDADPGDVTAYCYALRCRGGFYLPPATGKFDKYNPGELEEELQKTHNFNKFAEQEVAVAGAIWWEDVVGVRTVKTNKDGQFFSGPVFLRDALNQDDQDQFGGGPLMGNPHNSVSSGPLTVTPRVATIPPGGSQQFRAEIKGDRIAVWSMREAPKREPVGTIDNDGLYKAPTFDDEESWSKQQHWYTATCSLFDNNLKETEVIVEINVTADPNFGKFKKQPKKPRRYKPDKFAFGALFELLSGKSQGKGPLPPNDLRGKDRDGSPLFEIANSYKPPPFTLEQ
jgi:hypothetical protein